MRKPRRTQLPPAPDTREETRAPLDREQIIAAGLNLLDKVGLEGLTMRNLAEELRVKAGSLYWHVRSKEELLDWLADAVCAGISAPEASEPWRKRLEALARAYREALHAHRDAAQLLAGTLPTGTNRLRLMESVFSTLLAAGFASQEAAYAGFLVNDFVTEFVVEEERFSAATGNSEGAAPSQAEFEQFFKSLSSEVYPSIVKLSQHLTSELDMDARFRFGVEVLLDGLEKRLR